ncbi:hypothetical protein [Staphylococcus epidermidis]|uniref:hypothetical protein n=1 Tax=Staphylococcus epidermidis TaxID=1282 RepID=UPI0011A662DA|nr:hypothetical protein [Staphylococcus epidermidis]
MRGEISKDEGFDDGEGNIISKVMGRDKRVCGDLFMKRSDFYDYVVLKCEGVSDYVRDYEMEELVS